MKDKEFEVGLVVGRFQVFHLGHKQVIDTALRLCKMVYVLIGSAQESRTEKNPLTFEERKEVIQGVYPDTAEVQILPLMDRGLGNNKNWGEYVLSELPSNLSSILFVSGKEDRRYSWFEDQNINELFLEKKDGISATRARQLMIENNRSEWEKEIPAEIYNKYDWIREIVLESQGNKETKSI